MFPFHIKSIIHQKGRTAILILIFSLLLLCVNITFMMYNTSKEIQNSIFNQMDVEVYLSTPITIKEKKDFISSTDYNHLFDGDRIKEVFTLREKMDADVFDVNMVLNGFTFFLPNLDGNYVLVDGKPEDLSAFQEKEMDVKRLKEKTIFGGDYCRLTSTSDAALTSILKTNPLKEGRTFTQEEMSGSEKIILSSDIYYLKDGKLERVKVGDSLNYTLWVKEDGVRKPSLDLRFEVVGILEKSNSTERIALIPEETFLSILERMYPLVEQELYAVGDYSGVVSLFPTYIKLKHFEDIFILDQRLSELNVSEVLYHYSSNVENYINLYGEIKGMTISFQVLFVAGIVTTLLTSLFVFYYEFHRRVKESGIWLSMGMDKVKLFSGYFLEYGILYFFSFLLSYFLSLKIADTLFKRFIPNVSGISFLFGWKEFLLTFLIAFDILTVSLLIFAGRIYKFSVKDTLGYE